MQRALVRLEREQQALRASEEFFRQAFEYAPGGMAIAETGGDQHGRLLRTNDALCWLLGRPAYGAHEQRRNSTGHLLKPIPENIQCERASPGQPVDLGSGALRRQLGHVVAPWARRPGSVSRGRRGHHR